jgi:cell division protease FtsH
MHYKDGHAQLTQELFDREVIFTADVEAIFGKRQWVSRADEILALNEHKDSDEHKDEANSEANKEEKAADAATNDNNDNTQTNG